jgi:hypothetical protein
VWAKTVLVVTGDHGYETTPIHQRVPDPDNPQTPNMSFGDFVEREGTQGKVAFLPQGTVGAVYMPGASTAKLKELAAKIKDRGNAACSCIDQVLSRTSLPGLTQLSSAHPSWYLGGKGDLLVTLKPGWAFGRAVSTQPAAVAPTLAASKDGELDNPNLASAGGPRNRAIAMLMDGPTSIVRQVPGTAMAVKATAENPAACSDAGGVTFARANASGAVGDDANARGHECQAETVDVPLSIAALLSVAVPARQIADQGRLLKEAIPTLKPPGDDEDLGPAPEDPPPPPPPPPPVIISRNSVQVIPARRPKDPFPFHGLIQRLKARVVDSKGRPLALTRRGGKLTSIEVSADFGKPQSIVRLTFYKRGRKGTGGVAKRLVAIAKFKPFAVKRGPAKLRLRVPDQFAPQYIGIAIQEVVTVARSAGKTVQKPVGRKGGGIAAIDNAEWLHRRKPTEAGGR